jgi:hypothetical protein
MKTWIRIATSLLVLCGSTASSACIVTSNGTEPAGTSYVFGHLDGVVNGTPQEVVKAAKSVLDEQEMHEVADAATGLDGKVTAKTALDTAIGITVNRRDEKTCKISIKIGTFGDHQISADLYEKIKAKLP